MGATTTTTPAKGSPHFSLWPDTKSLDGTWLGHVAGWSHWAAFGGVTFGLIICVAVLKVLLEDRSRKGGEGSTAGLNYVVGPMGSGKSMFGVRTIVDALCADKYVITNVRLLPGWAVKVVERRQSRECRSPARKAAAVARLEGRYIYEQALRTAMRYRVPCAQCGGDVKVCGHVGPHQEARAVFIWDETHNDLNNRDYQGHGADRDEREREKERRRLVIRWATQLRKLGFSGYLLSQHHENTDAQLRRVCNHLIRLQNQRNAEGNWLARLLPRRLTMFLVYWYPAHLASGTSEHMIQPIRRERYWLPWTRHLYDSWETFHGIDTLEGEDAPILLPKGGRPAAEDAGATSSAGAPAYAGVGAHHATTTTTTTATA